MKSLAYQWVLSIRAENIKCCSCYRPSFYALSLWLVNYFYNIFADKLATATLPEWKYLCLCRSKSVLAHWANIKTLKLTYSFKLCRPDRSHEVGPLYKELFGWSLMLQFSILFEVDELRMNKIHHFTKASNSRYNFNKLHFEKIILFQNDRLVVSLLRINGHMYSFLLKYIIKYRYLQPMKK